MLVDCCRWPPHTLRTERFDKDRGLRAGHALLETLVPTKKWHEIKWDDCYLSGTKVHSSMDVYLLEERPKLKVYSKANS